MLIDFDTVEDGGADRQRDHRRRHGARRAGDDGPAVHPRRSRRTSTPACPIDAAAVLLVEVDGLPARRRGRRRAHRRDRHAPTAPAPCASRRTRPSGRCCGRAARRRSARSPGSSPTTTCTTRSCRAGMLPEVLAPGLRDRRAPRPAGDERVPRRRRQPASAAGVRQARAGRDGTGARRRRRDRRVPRSRPGGVLSGEHGIGLEKRDFMPLMFGPADLAAQAAMRRAFDPVGLANPFKVLPSAGRVRRRAARARGRVGVSRPRRVRRRGRRRPAR